MFLVVGFFSLDAMFDLIFIYGVVILAGLAVYYLLWGWWRFSRWVNDED
tara:strand:- start:2727 stop:2873 length:147 start_codon:yes stop_codon:yes gene_type:complete